MRVDTPTRRRHDDARPTPDIPYDPNREPRMTENQSCEDERGRDGRHDERRDGDRLRLDLAEVAELGIWCWEMGSDHVWMNRACRRILGFGEGEPVTREA